MGFWLAFSAKKQSTPPKRGGSGARRPAPRPPPQAACRFTMERTKLLTTFTDFGLADPIARALVEENYVTPTPIQAQTIPLGVSGRAVVGIAPAGHRQSA